MTRFRHLLAALLIAAAAIIASAGSALAYEPGAPVAQEHPPAAAGEHQPATGGETSTQEGHAGAEHNSWFPVIAKAVNFTILVAVLVYFLRVPLLGYLKGRIGKVREDLVTAAQTRQAAVRQLAEIDAKLAALPSEIEALKKRGAEDLVAERARIELDAQVERQRLLEHTRREIEMRLRVAKRELLELAADLAVRVASDRIRTSITADDQARLVDRYASQLSAGTRAGGQP
jgi:F-type H+-transporting ATPase subunit b